MSLPSLRAAIAEVATIYYSGKGVPDAVLNSPEPCRAIAYHCGYEVFDGTPWWDMLMDGVNCWQEKK